MSYRKPGVEVIVQENRRIINIAEDVRVPAIIGSGPSTITVSDEAIQSNGAGETDQLGYTPTDHNAVILTSLPVSLAPSGSINYVDNLYVQDVDYTIDAAGEITWDLTAGTDAAGDLEEGDIVYANYIRAVDSSQYIPTLFVDSDMVRAMYGEENVSTGILTIAGRIALENGSPAVILCQTEGDTETNYTDALKKLEKQRNVGYIVSVAPSGSMGLSDMHSIQAHMKSHIDKMSRTDIGLERGMIIGDSSDEYLTDGIDINGATEISTYVARAKAIGSKQVIYVAPAEGTRKDSSGDDLVLDANFASAGIAGLIAAQRGPEIPIHGFQLVGFKVPNDRWSDFEMNQMGAAGILVLAAHRNVMKIRDAITTDTTSAETLEISVVDIERRVKRALRTSLNNTFMGRGVVINPSTEDDIAGVTEMTLQSLVRSGVIVSYGRKNDPDTGETPISAAQDPIEPRKVNVTCSYKPSYPLKYITVTVNTYV